MNNEQRIKDSLQNFLEWYYKFGENLWKTALNNHTVSFEGLNFCVSHGYDIHSGDKTIHIIAKIEHIYFCNASYITKCYTKFHIDHTITEEKQDVYCHSEKLANTVEAAMVFFRHKIRLQNIKIANELTKDKKTHKAVLNKWGVF